MANVQSPELALVDLVKQRDAITAQINSLLHQIVGGAVVSAAPAAAAVGRPAAKGRKAKRRGRPAGSKNLSSVGAAPSTSAAPKKRGRPVGWRKNAAAAPVAATAAPAAGAAPKKRGRPVGWRKNAAAPADASAPKKRGRPVGWRKATTANAAAPGPAKRSAGRPKGAKNRSKK